MRRLHSRRRNKMAFLILSSILMLFIIFFLLFTIRLLPVVKTMAVNSARNIATQTINKAAGKVISDEKIGYDDLMTLEKDSNGNITAVKADTLKIDKLKYEITSEVIKELDDINTSDLGIPIGTVIGGQLFSGIGPKVKVKIEPVGSAETKIVNEFTSAGINQTRQQILLEVDASITVIVSSTNISTDVKSNYTIADTVIVGNVPNSYTVVDDNSGKSKSDKIIMYGGKNKK